jgi:hypothetical protein
MVLSKTCSDINSRVALSIASLILLLLRVLYGRLSCRLVDESLECLFTYSWDRYSGGICAGPDPQVGYFVGSCQERYHNLMCLSSGTRRPSLRANSIVVNNVPKQCPRLQFVKANSVVVNDAP